MQQLCTTCSETILQNSFVAQGNSGLTISFTNDCSGAPAIGEENLEKVWR